jgi:hypothetical protein
MSISGSVGFPRFLFPFCFLARIELVFFRSYQGQRNTWKENDHRAKMSVRTISFRNARNLIGFTVSRFEI